MRDRLQQGECFAHVADLTLSTVYCAGGWRIIEVTLLQQIMCCNLSCLDDILLERHWSCLVMFAMACYASQLVQKGSPPPSLHLCLQLVIKLKCMRISTVDDFMLSHLYIAANW